MTVLSSSSLMWVAAMFRRTIGGTEKPGPGPYTIRPPNPQAAYPTQRTGIPPFVKGNLICES